MSDKAIRNFKLFENIKNKDIRVSGSLNPDKTVQDRVRVLETNGISQGLRATDYKDPVKITVGVDKSINGTSIIEYANCLTTRDRGVSARKSEGTAVLEYNTNHPNRLGNIYNEQFDTGYAGNVWDKNGISPVLTTMQGDGRQPMITDRIRIRKLTPEEYWILMGLTIEDCIKAENLGISNKSLYEIAGNGIVTNCIKLIAEHLYKAQYNPDYICFDEEFNENFIHPQVE